MIGTGHRIKQLRLSLGFNQAEFANEIGVSQPVLSNVENQHVTPGFELITIIVEKFRDKGASYEWLLDTGRIKAGKEVQGVIKNLQKIIESEQSDINQLAAQCGMFSERIKNILKHNSPPTLEEVIKLLGYFDSYNANWLLLNKGRIKIPEKEQQMEDFLRLKEALLESMDKNLKKEPKSPKRK